MTVNLASVSGGWRKDAVSLRGCCVDDPCGMLRRRWQSDADAFAIFTHDGWKLMQRDPLPMQVVAEDPRFVVVRKPSAGAAR